MASLTIVKATEQDIPKLQTLLNAAFYQDFMEYGYEPPSYNRPYADYLAIVNHGHTYMGYVGEEAVTTVAVVPVDDQGTFEIKAFGTLPQWQNHGFGRQMMDAVHSCVQAKLFTLTTPPDKEYNMRFYLSFGYKVVDSFLEEGRTIDVFEMVP